MFTQPFIRAQIKENIKAPRHWPLWGNSPGTGEFPAQMASNVENVSISWRHHDISAFMCHPLVYNIHYTLFPDRIRGSLNTAARCWRWVLYIKSIKSYGHDDVIKWKHFPRYWPFVRGIHRSPVNFTYTKASDAELWCFLWSTSE